MSDEAQAREIEHRFVDLAELFCIRRFDAQPEVVERDWQREAASLEELAAKRRKSFEDMLRKFREFCERHPEFAERAGRIEALPIPPADTPQDKVLEPARVIADGTRPLTWADFSDAAVERMAEGAWRNRSRYQWGLPFPHACPVRVKKWSNKEIAGQCRASIRDRAQKLQGLAMGFENRLRQNPGATRAELRRRGVTVEQARQNHGFFRLDAAKAFAAMDAWENLLIELSGFFKARGHELWRLMRDVLINPKQMQEAEAAIWKGYKEGARKQKILSLDAKKLTPRRRAAYEKILRAEYGPEREERTKQLSALGLRGRYDKRSWRLREPWTLKMLVDVHSVLENSRIPRRQLKAYTIAVFQRWFRRCGVEKLPAFDTKVVADQLRYSARANRA